MRATELKRPLRRRIGRLVITITAEGIELRGYKRRRRKLVTWGQVASLADDGQPLLAQDEAAIGRETLQKLNADPSAPVTKERTPSNEGRAFSG